MRENVSAPMYALRDLQLIGWCGIQHALDCLCPDNEIKSGVLVAINAEKMLAIEVNGELKSLIEAAEFKYADGISIVRAIHKKFPQAQITRIAGIDLWEALMMWAGQNGIPVFLVGGKSKVLEQTEQGLRALWKVNIVGSQDGYFMQEERYELFKRICRSKAKIVTVAMGSPRQEILMYDCRHVYPNALYMGVGGTYDVFTGHVKRAPKVWRNMGFEWLYRLLLQPSRITRQIKLLRYLSWHYTNKI